MTTPGQVRNIFPAYRIFIFGIEVTEDVLSNVINWHDGRAPNTAEFVLANKFDKYTITEQDLRLLYGDLAQRQILPDAAQTFAPASSIQYQTPEQITTSLNDGEVADAFGPNSAKGRTLFTKITIREPITQPDLSQQIAQFTQNTTSQAQATTIPAFSGDAPRYPLTLGRPIFHSNDPVRIFWRDFDNPQIWYHGFAGFMSSYEVSVKSNGESTITIRCEDVLRIFRYSRVSFNPGLDIAGVQTSNDTVVQSPYKDGFGGLMMQEVLTTLIFGAAASGVTGTLTELIGEDVTSAAGAILPGYRRIGYLGETNSSISTDGIGSFNFKNSRIYLFGPSDLPTGAQNQGQHDPAPGDVIGGLPVEAVPDLAHYQAQIDHRVYADDLYSLLSPDANASIFLDLVASITPTGTTPGEQGSYPNVSDVITVLGQHPEMFPVDFGRLVMLIPRTLGNNVSTALVWQDLIDSYATHTNNWQSRLALIYNMCERIEFSFYATPKGDLVVEMPLYDFDPEDFGTTEFDFTPIFVSRDPRALQKRGPYAPRYMFTRRDILEWAEGFDDEKVRTRFRVAYLNEAGLQVTATQEDVIEPPVYATATGLIPLFGVREEKVDPYGHIASAAAAVTYANLKMNQANADAESARIETVPRLGIGPNRPLKYLYHLTDALNSPLRYGFISTCRSQTMGIVWNSSVSGTIGSNYKRDWDGQLTTDGRRLFSPLCGFATRVLNYNLIFNGTAGERASASTPTSVPNGASAAAADNAVPQESYKSITQQQATNNTNPNAAAASSLTQAQTVATNTRTFLSNQGIAARVTSVGSTARRDQLIMDRGTSPNASQVDREALDALLNGRDPHAAGRAFDIQGFGDSSNQDVFNALVDPNSVHSSADKSEIVGLPADPSMFPGGAKIILETGNNHVHVQWTQTSRKQGWTSNP